MWRLGVGQVLVLALSRLAKILFCLAIKYLDQSKLAVLKQLTGQDKTAEGKKGFLHARRQTLQLKHPPRAYAKELPCGLISLPLEEAMKSRESGWTPRTVPR